MQDFLAAIDSMLADWMPPLAIVLLWGSFTGAICMAVYAYISPQQKLLALKQLQKDSRRELMSHDGGFDELQNLIFKDLGVSLKLLGIAFLPFLFSTVPCVALMYYLYDLYGSIEYTFFGPDWMHGFTFWYILAMTLSSLIVKLVFRIH